MYLVPIKPKLSINKWINLTVKYDDTYTLKDILNDFVNEIYPWLNMQYEFTLTIEKNTFLNNIINILYENNYKSITDDKDYEFFSLKFNEDIYHIYTKYYNTICIDIGHNILKNNYMIIFDYIYDNITFYDIDDDKELYEDNTYDDYNYI